MDRPGAQASADRAALWGNVSTVAVLAGVVGIAGGVYLWRTSRTRLVLTEAALHVRACAAFELSQRLDPQFGTLFNLAGCYINTGKIATAWILYKGLSRSDSNVQRRSRAAELVTELEPQLISDNYFCRSTTIRFAASSTSGQPR